jgi:hypothetical protein
MQTDERGFRVAVLASELANSDLDVLGALQRAGWGAVVLPPAWYPDDTASDLLVQFAEQIEEFVRHGYRVVCIGSCEGLRAPLSELGVDLPRTITATTEDELLRLLDE